MSYTMYKLNDVVYISQLGYGTLVDCGKFSTVSVKEIKPTAKRESIHFDPDLFNSDGDSNKSKKSSNPPEVAENTSQDSKTKPEETNSKEEEPKQEMADQAQQTEQKPKDSEKLINIVKLKLESPRCVVHTPDTNIRKHVRIPVKPMFTESMEGFKVRIDISKTIDAFKKQIFDWLGLKIAYYQNIKIYATNPVFTELSVHSKTIEQYQLKEWNQLVLTADYTFCFQDIPPQLEHLYKLANNSMTLVNHYKRDEPQPRKANNILPFHFILPEMLSSLTQAVSTTQEAQTDTKDFEAQGSEPNMQQEAQGSEPNMQQEAQGSQTNKDMQDKEQKSKEKERNESEQQSTTDQVSKAQVIQQNETVKPFVDSPCFSFIRGLTTYSSGYHYWELKIEKQSQDERGIQIGVMSERLMKAWVYCPLARTRKILTLQEQTSDANIHPELEGTEEYGTVMKEGQSLGVLLEYDSHRTGRISFYKNNVHLGTCFEGIEGETIPIFGLGIGAMVSLDTRAPPPLDFYSRRR